MSQMHGDGGEDHLAPVTPLFGDRVVREHEHAEHPVVEPDDGAQRAEEALVRKLRARSLSVSEARQVLRRQELASADIEDVIDRFCERGYLDDALLAEHLVLSGVERRGQGRVALSRLSLSAASRGTYRHRPRRFPDDDAERALEFARSKARSCRASISRRRCAG